MNEMQWMLKFYAMSLCLLMVIDGVKATCDDEQSQRCEIWCENHPVGWDEKCQWSKSCGGCSQCRCKVWCDTNPTPWKKTTSDETVEENFKCDWTKTCSGCPECSQESPPTISPTPAPTEPCRNWCESHPKPWSEKCKWSKNCGGCPQCAPPSSPPSSVPPSSTPSLAPVKECQGWCLTIPESIMGNEEKCSYSECGACPSCSFPNAAPSTPPSHAPSAPPSHAPTKGCQEWCAYYESIPWTDSNNATAETKCELEECGGCSQCTTPTSDPSGIPSSSPSPTLQPSLIPSAPSPAPSKGCQKWCANHSKPWKEKCHWPVNCGGCSECNDDTIIPP